MPDSSGIFTAKPNILLSNLNRLREQNVMCDIILIVGTKKITAHRLVLASYSDYFCKMFTSHLVESQQKEVCMHAVDELAMEALVNYFYTNDINLNEDNVEDILSAATLLQVENLKVACCQLLRRQLNPSNCLGIGDFADGHACTELKLAANKYVCDAFQWVVKEEEFLLLPVNQLVKLISSDNLRVDGEDIVYEAVMRWVRHDTAQRQKLLCQVLCHVRLRLLGSVFLDKVCVDPLIAHDPECSRLVEDAKKQIRILQNNPCPGRALDALFLVGGGNQCSILEGFDMWPAPWRKMSSTLPYEKPRAAYLNGRVYLVGRILEAGQSHASMEIFDPERNRWSRGVAPSAWFGSLVVCGGFLYSIGGTTSPGISLSLPCNLVERYNPKMKKWVSVTPMLKTASNLVVITLDGFIYALSCADDQFTVERYDPHDDKWTTDLEAITERGSVEAIALNGKIYITGKNRGSLGNTEVYDPQSKKLNSIRDPKALCAKYSIYTTLLVVNGKLYALTDNMRVWTSGVKYCYVEVYDETNNTWSKCGRLMLPFSGLVLSQRITVIPASKKYARPDFYSEIPSLQPRCLQSLFRKRKPFQADFQKSSSCFQDTLTCYSDPEYDEKDSDTERPVRCSTNSSALSSNEDTEDDDMDLSDDFSNVYNWDENNSFFESDWGDEDDMDDDGVW